MYTCISFKMMLELNERYSDVTFRLFVVRSAKGDTPTSDTLWQGASGKYMEQMDAVLHTYIYTCIYK